MVGGRVTATANSLTTGPATGSAAGDITAAETSTTGKLWLGTSGTLGLIYRNANGIQIGGSGTHIGTNAADKDFSGTCTLISGSCSVSFHIGYASGVVCVANDTSGAYAVQVVATTSSVAFSGHGADVIAYICVGNPN